MGGLYSHTTRATGTVLTATIYNGDHQNHIDNETPQMMDDYSANAAQMQSNTSPGGVGTESLATSLAGELERLRYMIKHITGQAQWYVQNAISIQGNLALGNVVTHNLSAGANDNATIANIATANVVRFTCAGDAAVSGIAGGTAGKLLLIINADTTDYIQFIDESISSSAANRITLNQVGPSVFLQPGQSAWLWYDGTSSRWRYIGHYDTLSTSNTSSASFRAHNSTATMGWDLTALTTSRFITWPDRSLTVGGALGTEVATTSGTSVDFTSITANATRITIMLQGVSTNGTSNIIVQLGDAGGAETTGYDGVTWNHSGATIGAWNNGAIVSNGVTAASVVSAKIVLTREDASDNTWNIVVFGSLSAGPAGRSGQGFKALSAVLDRVRLTTEGGANTFDAGTMNILVE